MKQPTPVERVPQNWYFTFGSGQQHDGKYVVIHGTHDAARDEMIAHFGNRWAFQYGTADRAGVDEFGLVELPRAEWAERGVAARRPTYSDPEFGEPDPDGVEDPAVRWNLDFGCNLSFGIDLDDASLVVNLNISDHPLRNAGLQKSVTREQLRRYALYLLRLADDQEREAAARQAVTR
ncbi:hypothetical protein ACQP2C_00030 [Micromonospora zamorensis]|uniref:hypothetical protein n=1 Tax=Micromonospora zamorensis TaxID=709883 RepID=UPI003D9931B8